MIPRITVSRSASFKLLSFNSRSLSSSKLSSLVIVGRGSSLCAERKEVADMLFVAFGRQQRDLSSARISHQHPSKPLHPRAVYSRHTYHGPCAVALRIDSSSAIALLARQPSLRTSKWQAATELGHDEGQGNFCDEKAGPGARCACLR